jgi:hypothetical protein
VPNRPLQPTSDGHCARKRLICGKPLAAERLHQRTRLDMCRVLRTVHSMNSMATADELYTELKPDIGAIASVLFDLSETFLRKRGNFLPHAAVLEEDGEVRLLAASTPNEITNSTEVLPLLHSGLRDQAASSRLKAIGVAENVTVTLEGQLPTQAIKVLCEHKRGLSVAIYLPFQKKLFRGYVFGSPISQKTAPEVNAWPENSA